MRKISLFLILSTCLIILSAVVLAVGPITNKKIGTNWGYQNCGLISDQSNLLNYDSEMLDEMKNLCRREKAMYDLEYCAFIINIVLGFFCADLALLHYMGIGKEFELKTGVIGFISGLIGFILTLVYVCYSGYIFNNDIAYMELDTNPLTFGFSTSNCVEKLYSNGASLQKTSSGDFIPVYNNDRGDFVQYIKYKDLGDSLYNYDSDYYTSYQGYNDINDERVTCQNSARATNCNYIYASPKSNNDNKELYDRWLTALILACFAMVCSLGLAVFGFFLFTNLGTFMD